MNFYKILLEKYNIKLNQEDFPLDLLFTETVDRQKISPVIVANDLKEDEAPENAATFVRQMIIPKYGYYDDQIRVPTKPLSKLICPQKIES